MTSRVGSWWQTRSITLRLTLVATLVLAVGLAVGAAALASLFFHNRLDAVDTNVRAESATLTTLLRTAQLPEPLPVPAGSPALAQVVDPGGTVRAATPSASRVVPLLPVAALVDHVDAGPFTTDDSALGSTPLRVQIVATRLGGERVLVVSAVPFGDVGDTLSALLRTLVIAVPIVLVAAAIATWLAVNSALRPVDQLREAADQVAFARRGTPPRLPVPGSGDELARLADTLNTMLDRLYRSAERQRAFVADAAHELRSPIAAIRTQLEVALTTETAPSEWHAVAADVLRDVDRVSTLADDMLLLARLDAGVVRRQRAVDLSALLELDAPPLWVDGDAAALRRAFDNLVANARRHARETVSTSGSRTHDRTVVVTVDDDGPGIAAADRERVFERWVRLDDARAREQGGAGLGLAIARAVARAHGGDVVLSESPLGGGRAQLQLPAGHQATSPASGPGMAPPGPERR